AAVRAKSINSRFVAKRPYLAEPVVQWHAERRLPMSRLFTTMLGVATSLFLILIGVVLTLVVLSVTEERSERRCILVTSDSAVDVLWMTEAIRSQYWVMTDVFRVGSVQVACLERPPDPTYPIF